MSQPPSPTRVLNVLLTHGTARAVAKMVAWWRDEAGARMEDVLIAHGGNRSDFAAVEHPHKVFIDDPRLRTRDHTRQRQSYRTIFHEASDWIKAHRYADVSHICFAEYDFIPLVSGFNERQIAAMAEEQADVLGLRVSRVDGTSHPHYLYHAHDPAFVRFWEGCSLREDRRAVLSMFGASHFWTREAFEAVAGSPEPFPIYLELFLPTTAHHLGFRVRPYPEPAAHAFIRHLGDMRREMPRARAGSAWAIHPVKSLWLEDSRANRAFG